MVPDYATIDATQTAELVAMVYPGRVPKTVQVLLLLTSKDEAFLVVALDTNIDRFITAATVEGFEVPLPDGLPPELDFAPTLVVTDSITLQEPIVTTPDQVLQDPLGLALQRVSMDTTYILGSIRVKDAPEAFKHMGFGSATDSLGSTSQEDYLTVVDPYNTEAQVRVAELVGTVLYPTETMRQLLEVVLRFAPDDRRDALDRPSVFYETLSDGPVDHLTIGDLVPTFQDPTLKLHTFHGEMVTVEGVALGKMVRTEDIPVVKRSPVHLTFKVMGVVDLTGAMPVVGISSEDVSGDVFGHFRFLLSVYRYQDEKALAFLISKETVPLDPVAHVTRAEFGDRVVSTLSDYTVTELAQTEVASDLILEQVDLLVPTDPEFPMALTRHPDLLTGDYLKSVSVDGFLIDARFLGVPSEFVDAHGAGVLVVSGNSIQFEKGAPPVVAPTPSPTVVPPTPTPTSIAVQPTATPTPTPTPVTYILTLSVSPMGSGIVTMTPPGDAYPDGTVVTLMAVSATGYIFDDWEGDASGSSLTATVTMDGAKSVVAHFTSYP